MPRSFNSVATAWTLVIPWTLKSSTFDKRWAITAFPLSASTYSAARTHRKPFNRPHYFDCQKLICRQPRGNDGRLSTVPISPGIASHRGSRTALSMRNEHFNKCASTPPRCPGCAQFMRLARITSRFDDLPDLYTFECQACDVSHIEAA